MTSSTRLRVQQMEAELLLFWRINQRGWKLYLTDPHNPELDELEEEIVVMSEVSEWPMMRAACRRTVSIATRLMTPHRRVA